MAILHGDFPRNSIRTILIPFGANVHTNLAMEIAPVLAEYFKAKINIAFVFEPGTTKKERDQKINQINNLIRKYSLATELKVIMAKDVLKGVVKLSKSADLILMGGRTGDLMELLLAKSLTAEITEQAACPVLWVKEFEERKSFWNALLKPVNKQGAEDER